MMLRILVLGTLALTCTVPALAQGAASCAVQIEANDAMQFNKKEIVVPRQCQRFSVALKHSGKLPRQAMGHNWVLSKSSDVAAVAKDGIAAGLDKQYLKPGDPRVLAATQMLGGGQSETVSFEVAKLAAGESYTFFCSFPGHAGIMKGVLKLG